MGRGVGADMRSVHGKVSRRSVLRAAAGLAALGVVPAWLASGGGLPIGAEGLGPRPHPGHKSVNRKWAMVIDLRKCEGCVTIDKPPQCTAACQAEHALPEAQTWIRVFEQPMPGGHYYFM